MKARYNRISTANQNLERQLAKQNPDEVLYNDVVSGVVKFAKREKGSRLISDITEGKINYVSVSSVDRIGRNLADIINTLEFFKENDVILKVDNIGMESMINGKENEIFNLIISVLSSISSMERAQLRERQREGITIAKAKGIYKGRVRGSKESNDVVLAKYKPIVKLLKEGVSLRRTAKLGEVSLGTVQKVKAYMTT